MTRLTLTLTLALTLTLTLTLTLPLPLPLTLTQGGLSDAELRDALQPYEHVALLRVAMHQAGQVRSEFILARRQGKPTTLLLGICPAARCTSGQVRDRGVCSGVYTACVAQPCSIQPREYEGRAG